MTETPEPTQPEQPAQPEQPEPTLNTDIIFETEEVAQAIVEEIVGTPDQRSDRDPEAAPDPDTQAAPDADPDTQTTADPDAQATPDPDNQTPADPDAQPTQDPDTQATPDPDHPFEDVIASQADELTSNFTGEIAARDEPAPADDTAPAADEEPEPEEPEEPDEPERGPVRFRLPRGRHRSPAPSPDSPAVSDLSKKFLAQQPVQCDDVELLTVTVLDLEKHRDGLMLEGKFFDSLKAQKAVDAARWAQLDATKRRNQQETARVVDEKKSTHHNESDQFNADMKKQEEDLEHDIKDNEDRLRARQASELEEHDKQWQDDPKQRQFNRSSQKLRILRVQQQLLMNARRFDEAAQVCKIADNLQTSEVREHHRQCLVEFLGSRTMLEKRHADEVETLGIANDLRRSDLQHKRSLTNIRLTNRSNALKFEDELAHDQERLWILKHRHDGDELVNVMGRTRPIKRFTRAAEVATFNTLPLPKLPSLSATKNKGNATVNALNRSG
jgi:hypothetical protein